VAELETDDEAVDEADVVADDVTVDDTELVCVEVCVVCSHSRNSPFIYRCIASLSNVTAVLQYVKSAEMNPSIVHVALTLASLPSIPSLKMALPAIVLTAPATVAHCAAVAPLYTRRISLPLTVSHRKGDVSAIAELHFFKRGLRMAS